MKWVDSGQVPPEFLMYGIAQVDNAFYRLMGVRVGGTTSGKMSLLGWTWTNHALS